jgi:iron complex outermembrane receptor protein
MLFRSITGFVKTEDAFTNDFSGNGNVMASNIADAEQLSEELQIQGSALSGKLNYLLGVYLFGEDATQNFAWNSYLPGVLPVLPVSTSALKIKTTSVSAFTQLDYMLTDALKVTGGIRYTKDEKRFDLLFRGLLPPITPARSESSAASGTGSRASNSPPATRAAACESSRSGRAARRAGR